MKQLTEVMVLEDLLDLLQEEAHWTKCAFARNEKDEPVEPTNPEACRWCMMGGMELVGHRLKRRHSQDEIREAQNRALGLLMTVTHEAVDGWGPMAFNDMKGIGHKEVVDAIDRAIKLGLEPVVNPKGKRS